MLAVILKILSILGIILLIFLGVVLLVLLLVLFMPIVYKVDAAKSDTEMTANVRARWLFGFLRAKYIYPEPGNVIVKVLWKTVYDSGKKSENAEKKPSETSVDKTTEIKTETRTDAVGESSAEQQGVDKLSPDTTNVANEAEASDAEETPCATETISTEEQEDSEQENQKENGVNSLKQKLFAKYEKIKYTIQQLCDKIKHIWDNITFYKKLLQDEQTKLLVSHAFRRLGKILRHIRPRKLKAVVIFGTGSPDTTGYAYGIYGMFSPQLGKNVFVTPDFTQKILVGNVYAAGHITIFTLLVNVLAVLFDKRLRILIRRLKNHSEKKNKQNADKQTANNTAKKASA